MSKATSALVMVGLAVAGLASGFFYNNWQQERKLEQAKKDALVKEQAVSTVRPLFKLKDTEGKVRDVKEWDGKVLMVNFWATWCPPCVKEMPAFIDLQEKYQDKGLVIVGIALDELNAVIDFIDPMGINYPILLGDEDGIKLSKAYGNRLGVLPYTVVVDRKGNIIHRKRSDLTFEQAEALIAPLL